MLAISGDSIVGLAFYRALAGLSWLPGWRRPASLRSLATAVQ
jgi:hypothetical protein